MTESNTLSYAALKIAYNSPSNKPFTHGQTLVRPSSPSNVEETAAYLVSLRQAVSSIQESVNKELTARMDEDKTRAEAGSKTATDEAKEEENYGEEVQENDD